MVKQSSLKPLQNVYLSLGSNMGDRFGHLQTALDFIFEEVGGIMKISPVYQTPALGFEGDDFLNCVAVVQSTFSPKKILKSVLAVEKKMGRERSPSKIVASRPIDIDILAVENTVIATPLLTVPHPEIQHRKFVLQPLADINAGWEHPVLHKKVGQLLAKTKDKSPIAKLSKWLKNPMNGFSISRFNYIAIEGNIGAGKTSLATMIANDFNAKLILERFKDNPFLPKFYQEPGRYAFPLEMSFLADRYQQLLEDIAQYDLFNDCIVADYDVYKSLIFAKITLQNEEFALYKKLFHIMHNELPKPDLYVYLYQNTETLLENIKKRGRPYEQNIRAHYLEKLGKGYLEFIQNQPHRNIKRIDISGTEFIKDRKNYLKVLREITS